MFNFFKKQDMPDTIVTESEDLYVLLDITTDDVIKTAPLKKSYLYDYIKERFADQPLKYFNETNRLKIVHLKTGMIKSVRLLLDA